MSFRANEANSMQTGMFDMYSAMSEREKKMLNSSWATIFAEKVFPAINEEVFQDMYSNEASRPNTPVNVLVGALILKELNGLSDDEVFHALLFDVRYRMALHTINMQEQPISDRSLGRFRARCETYKKETGKDPLHDCITGLSGELAEIMKIDRSLRRMDSMMIESNIKRMSRLQLLYACMAGMMKYLKKTEKEIPDTLKHYLNQDDKNLFLYHNRAENTASKINTILEEAKVLMELCAGGGYDEVTEYQLLIRALDEQATQNEDGGYQLKQAGDPTMSSEILQTPTDPEATYRSKAGKEHIGYSANIVEETGEAGSIVTDYQFEQNTHSDAAFATEYMEKEGNQAEMVTVVADGAYSGAKVENAAKENNFQIVNTNLTGKEAPDLAADFVFNEDGTMVVKCPNGIEPKSCCHNKNGSCVVSFHKEHCENCPYFDQCKPKLYAKTARKIISQRTQQRAQKQRDRKTETFRKMSAFRNGVETVPSFLRRIFHVDQMPVRGKLRSEIFFGCKIAGLNVLKFCKFQNRRNTSAQIVLNEG